MDIDWSKTSQINLKKILCTMFIHLTFKAAESKSSRRPGTMNTLKETRLILANVVSLIN